MSITITTDVFCDHCANWCDGVSDGLKIRRKAARAQAKAKGWKHILNEDGKWIDLCPECYEDRDRETEEPEHSTDYPEPNERHIRVLGALGIQFRGQRPPHE